MTFDHRAALNGLVSSIAGSAASIDGPVHATRELPRSGIYAIADYRGCRSAPPDGTATVDPR